MAVDRMTRNEPAERWRLGRIGILNFWHYDEEVFELEGGRLILRGANGSGKSVTMQSFLPLVLDGDKRPHRLDPFGSRVLSAWRGGQRQNGCDRLLVDGVCPARPGCDKDDRHRFARAPRRVPGAVLGVRAR